MSELAGYAMDKPTQQDKPLNARERFGKIVQALRVEQVDEGTFRPWTQHKLSEITGLSISIIRNIEVGRKAQIEEDVLLKLADAFGLTSSERREFFLASVQINRSDIVRQESSPEEALTKIMGYLKGIRLPFYISDSYCDVIRVNRPLVALLNMEEALDSASKTPAGYNTARAVFDEAYNYRKLMGSEWEKHAIYNMRYFRERTLTSRHTDYFRYLHSNLMKLQQFYRYWVELRFDQSDYFSGHIGYSYTHPRFGPIEYTACETVTVTAAGNLSTIVYGPLNTSTVQAFELLANEVGTNALKLASWPGKSIPDTQ